MLVIAATALLCNVPPLFPWNKERKKYSVNSIDLYVLVKNCKFLPVNTANAIMGF